jgi:hypothetical protein
LTAFWVATLVWIADPPPCEPVAGMPGVWRCPGERVCREGRCVGEGVVDPRTIPEPAKPAPAGISTGQWLNRHSRLLFEAGPFINRETAGGLEDGNPGFVVTAGLSFQVGRRIAIELPFAYEMSFFSSRTITPQPFTEFGSGMELSIFWLPVVANLALEWGPLRIKVGGGPELALAFLSVDGNVIIGSGPSQMRTFVGETETAVRPALQWFAAIEGPVERRWSLGIAYRGHLAGAHFRMLEHSDVDIGGNSVALRLTFHP